MELPGIASPADVSVDVLDGRAVEVTAGESFRLAHSLPFVLAVGHDGASKVKFSRKTQTLTLTFDPRATVSAPPRATPSFPRCPSPACPSRTIRICTSPTTPRRGDTSARDARYAAENSS